MHASGRSDLVTGLRTHTHIGPPDWERMLATIAKQHEPERVDVFFCGPPGLSAKLRPICERARDDVPRGEVLMKVSRYAILLVLTAACHPATREEGPAATRDDPNACASCHMRDYDGAKHHSGVKPTACGVCHTQERWHPTRLAHDFWALDGAHAKETCFDCHKGTPVVFRGTSKDCISCHQADDDKANAALTWHRPFATTCADCHTTTAWKPSFHVDPTKAVPSATATTTATATATAIPTAKPTATAKPKPRPTATATATATATTTATATATATAIPTADPTVDLPPDVTTGPSRRR